MHNIFIDTNIFLAFYHYSSDDLDELNKLVLLINKNKIKLFLPEQVIEEFYRNREVKISDALNRFKEEKLSNQFPQICKEFKEYEQMRDFIKKYQESKSKLLDLVLDKIKKRELKADKVIERLFKKAQTIKMSTDIIDVARLRYDKGNPPGKKNSYGDSINWESLLKHFPNKKDIYFISDDKDYLSPIDTNDLSNYLRSEWEQNKNSKIYFYKRLSTFIKEYDPDINLTDELEKERLIHELAASPDFATTRIILRQLVKYSDFTNSQINDIVQATIYNNQVYLIADDYDINQYLRQLVRGYENQIIPELFEEFKEYVFKD